MTDTITSGTARSVAGNLRRTLATGWGRQAGLSYEAAARGTIAAWEARADELEQREAKLLPWGQQFLRSPAWRGRRGYVTRGKAELGRYLEERAITSADLAGAELITPGPSPLVAPIASRCDARPASPGSATVIRWSGPARPGPVAEGEVKPGAGLTPELTPVPLPFVAYWVGLSRTVLDDEAQLASVVDGRLRRGLGLALDDQIAGALAGDDAIDTAGGPDLAGAIRNAVGQLAAAGYFADTTVLVSPGDLAAAGSLADLPLLGVTAIIPTAGLEAGTAIAADLRSAVQVRYHGTAAVQTTDSHAGQFVRNEITLLAEQRALGAVADPAAAVKATPGANGED